MKVALALSYCVISVLAFVQVAFAQWGKFDLVPGDTFMYVNHGGGQKILIYEGQDEKKNHRFHSKGSGETVLLNAHMAHVAEGRLEYHPHTGLTSERMVVGERWSHSLQQRANGVVNYVRDRSCKVEELMQKKVPAGTFDALYVKCESKRADRQLPRYEKIWYDTKTGVVVLREYSWYGSSPGEETETLTEVRLAPRAGSTDRQ